MQFKIEIVISDPYPSCSYPCQYLPADREKCWDLFILGSIWY